MTDQSSPQFYEVSEDFVSLFRSLWDARLGNEVSYKLVGNTKIKTGIKVRKVPAVYYHLLNKEIIVEVNESLVDALEEDKDKSLLIDDALSTISYNTETGKVGVSAFSVVSNPGVLQKYGNDNVIRVKELIHQAYQQAQDAAKDAK